MTYKKDVMKMIEETQKYVDQMETIINNGDGQIQLNEQISSVKIIADSMKCLNDELKQIAHTSVDDITKYQYRLSDLCLELAEKYISLYDKIDEISLRKKYNKKLRAIMDILNEE